MSKAKRIDALRPVGVAAFVAERRKLHAKWLANQRAQFKLQHRLDRLTTKLMKSVGLEAWLR